MTSKPFLESTKEAAVQEYVEGRSLKEVGQRHNTSGSVVACWVRKNGYDVRPAKRRPKATLKQKEEIADLYQNGVRVIDLAKQFNVNPCTITKWLKDNDCPRNQLSRVDFPYGPIRVNSKGYLQRTLHHDYWLFPYGRESRGDSRMMLEHRRVVAESIGRSLYPQRQYII